MFWLPEFGHPNRYSGLLNGLNMSLDICICVKGSNLMLLHEGYFEYLDFLIDQKG